MCSTFSYRFLFQPSINIFIYDILPEIFNENRPLALKTPENWAKLLQSTSKISITSLNDDWQSFSEGEKSGKISSWDINLGEITG